MDESEQDKSEQPTPFKLARTRRKGVVARGADLGFLTGLLAATGSIWIAGPSLGDDLSRAMRGSFVIASNAGGGSADLLAITGEVLTAVVRPVLLVAAVIFTVVLLFEIVQTGFLFSATALKPDFSRLNPAKGLKRLFTVRMLIETAKNVLKMAVYGSLVALAIYGVLKADPARISDAAQLADAMLRSGLRLMVWFLFAAFLFAAFDQFVVRRDFLKRMRMSRREVRRELRDREGEPRMKQRRKQLHAEFVKMSESLRNIRGADVLVTNPVHFAVALRYDPQRMVAPRVTSKGTNAFALRLRRLAFTYNIPIVDDRTLAKALYRGCELNGEIPEDFYRPVADIYQTIRARSRRGTQQNV